MIFINSWNFLQKLRFSRNFKQSFSISFGRGIMIDTAFESWKLILFDKIILESPFPLGSQDFSYFCTLEEASMSKGKHFLTSKIQFQNFFKIAILKVKNKFFWNYFRFSITPKHTLWAAENGLLIGCFVVKILANL